MRSNPQFPVDLVTFADEILNGKLHFLCSVKFKFYACQFAIPQKYYDDLCKTSKKAPAIASFLLDNYSFAFLP